VKLGTFLLWAHQYFWC